MSKVILQRINREVREKTGLNQWQSTQDSLKWFENLENKKDMTFFQFDIENFYPSINEDLLRKALQWADDYSYISETAKDIIMLARKTFLYDGQYLWSKKDTHRFDVSIGSYDGAEACEIVGLYLLYKLTEKEKVFEKEYIGIFRDDGLSVMTGNGHQKDKKRKDVIRLLKEEGLSITWEINLTKVQYLDILFDLENNCYKPFHKLNSRLSYVGSGSNHPRKVLENIPEGINRRLSNISSNKKCFDEEKCDYQNAIKESGYSNILTYEKGLEKSTVKNIHGKRKNIFYQHNQDKNINSKRNIVWFTPPFNIFCSTNVGEIFRRLIEKHFSRNKMLGKLFNKNTLKISYSCLPNIKAKIGSHNKVLIYKSFEKDIVSTKCNCQKSIECPLNGQCVVSSVIYKAEILEEGEKEGNGHIYVGLAGGAFKLRLANHLQSFKNESKQKQSKLSEYIWGLKNRNIESFEIKWSIIANESGFNRKSRRCQLCIREKVEILRMVKIKPNKLINKRDEIFRRCLHRKKHFLGSILENNNHVIPIRGDHQFPQIQDNNLRIEGASYNSSIDSNTPRQYNVTGESNTQQGISEVISKRNQVNDNNCVQTLPLAFGSTRSGKIWRTDHVDQT